MTSKAEFVAKRKTGPHSQETERQTRPWQDRYRWRYNPETAIGPSPRIGATIVESCAPRFV